MFAYGMVRWAEKFSKRQFMSEYEKRSHVEVQFLTKQTFNGPQTWAEFPFARLRRKKLKFYKNELSN